MNLSFRKRFVFSVVTFIFSLGTAFALDSTDYNKNAYNHTSEIYATLENWGFFPRRTDLVPGTDDLFPEDISFTVSRSRRTERESSIYNLIFSFTHDFFIYNTEFIKDLIISTEDANLPYDVTFLFSSEGFDSVLPQKKAVPSKASFFERFNYEYENMCVIAAYEPSGQKSVLATKGTSASTPKWLVQVIKNTYAQNDMDLDISSRRTFNSNIENARVKDFLDREIPSAGIPVTADTEHLKMLLNLEENLCSQINLEWNNHYVFISTGTTGFWLSETFFVLIYIFFALISVFALSFSSFLYNAKNNAILKDFSRSWYLILLKLAVIAILFFVVNLIFCIGRPKNYILTGLRNIVVLGCAAFLMSLQIKKKFKFSYAVTGYELLIISTLNVLIFTSVNFSYLMIFLAQYLIVVMFRRTKNIYLNFFMLIVILLFSLPYMMQSDSFTFIECILNAFVLYPAMVQIQRLFVLLHVIDQVKTADFIRTQIIWFCSLLIFFATTYVPMYFISAYKNRTGVFVHRIEKSPEKNVELSLTENSVYDYVNYSLEIKSLKNALRHNIYFDSRSEQIIGECNFKYDIISPTRAEIILPDIPPEKMEIIFSSLAVNKLVITVETYFYDETGTVHMETSSIKFGD